jgi:hypothetical protein
MTPSIKRGFGVLAFLAIALLLAAGARSVESQEPAPTAAAQGEAATPTHPSQEQMAQEMEADPCQSMMGKMGMSQRGGMPGMGMMGMRMHGGMGMPGMEMGGMGMMPMMHGQMMMRMMARNPKLAGKMLQMRADMMRAMAEVLTKYGKEMESGQWPAPQGKGGAGE